MRRFVNSSRKDVLPNLAMSSPEDDEPMEPRDEETLHLDWSKMVRGLHYILREKGTAILDEDVYSIFRTSEEVNNALLMVIREGRIPHPKKSRKDQRPLPPGQCVAEMLDVGDEHLLAAAGDELDRGFDFRAH